MQNNFCLFWEYMKCCCERFESYYESGSLLHDVDTVREVYPNIKIVKLKEPEKNPYRYFIVAGFMKDKPPTIAIAFCPFCGADLFKKYKHDDCVNADIDAISWLWQ